MAVVSRIMHGFQILHSELIKNSKIIITELLLRHNGLTEVSSSMISDLIIGCKLKLDICGNEIVGEDERLYTPC